MMRRIPLAPLVLSSAMALASPPAHGLDAPLGAADPVLEAHVRRIAQELRCRPCDNQTLAESNAAIADNLRAQVRAMLRVGASDDDVRAFLTSRYGDVVLYRAPWRASSLALWWGPATLLAAAGVAVGLTLRRRSRAPKDRFERHPDHASPEPLS
jgi:cytochrome c-type biogenesis protein CcmH